MCLTLTSNAAIEVLAGVDSERQPLHVRCVRKSLRRAHRLLDFLV